MSYIYALYFIEQKAVKIGKADDLLNRLSDLVATWGNIDPYRAKAWEIDEQLVIGGEQQLHNKYKKYRKQMPEGDGSTEFFEPFVWELLSDNFVPISKTLVIDKVNFTNKQKPKTYTSITLNLSKEEKEQLSILYGSNTGIKEALLNNIVIQLSDDKLKKLHELENTKTIESLDRENIELKRQLAISREQHQNAMRERDSQKRRADRADDKYKAINAKLNEFLNEPTDVQNKIIQEHLLSVKQELFEQNASLSHQSGIVREQRDYYQREMTVARRHVRTARRLLKRATTLVSSLKPIKPTKLQTKSMKKFTSDIDQFLIDIELI